MSGIGSKLSKHVLGMKFMRKTKEEIDKVKVEKVHREQFSSDVKIKLEAPQKVKCESTTTLSSGPNVEELWSYNQCERYIFGRQSFGGFNPTLEKNVRKGIWKPFYLDEAGNAEESEDDDNIKKQSDADVSDEEMAKTFGSLVGTLAKRFKKRHKKEAMEEQDDETDERKPPKWSKKFKGNNKDGNRSPNKGKWKGKKNKNAKNQQAEPSNSPTNSDWDKKGRGNKDQPKPSKRRHEEDDSAPSKKKRKFLKPSDD